MVGKREGLRYITVLEILCLCRQRLISDIEMLMPLPMGHLTIMCISLADREPRTSRDLQVGSVPASDVVYSTAGLPVWICCPSANSSSVWTKFCPFTAASVNRTVCQIRGPTTVASSLSLGLGPYVINAETLAPLSVSQALASQSFLNSLPSLNPG